ncbi:hypothetical protein CMQ_7960 [Grosmannia clavigera kw1407]|uniref:Uncharacterized protein n=1 Tax=Grosmannia clavigera (strain kw1407 / UAMH 11150) TaxID=655863 RepID=F0XSA5_GROCL|nr:uncharacterized protein CMQ_7960 [Grosmannia clavigera kw1407]EFW99592.1 hypothetical protein CMQ_7960 [Grosmannia clavigera kw1407]
MLRTEYSCQRRKAPQDEAGVPAGCILRMQCVPAWSRYRHRHRRPGLLEFSLQGKVAVVSAGALVHVIDRLTSPAGAFGEMAARAAAATSTGSERLDGLVAAAGIQQETAALDYTAADFD